MLFYILLAGVPGLILMVLLVVCLVCWKRRRAKKLEAGVLNQMTETTSRNNYSDEDEEDEADYVNVEPVDINSLRAEEEYDDSHDYEEPDEGAVASAGNTEEQTNEEDSTSSELDYVNLEEQTVDIYGEELDIYQNI
ncbi:hypothetical protein CRENBAI_013619 [Crenichthys baileyi]|uniref:Linker for activation of T-cells family member 2 n=1 Tax=Crenichthys baileyi TaxID=28760 RepID=A0AAV9RXZ4_9TELE